MLTCISGTTLPTRLIAKKSLPYSQFLRVKRICSFERDFCKHSEELIQFFLNRGYPMDLLQNALLKAKSKDRQALLKPPTSVPNTDKHLNNNLFAITTYQPGSTLLKQTIISNWDFLSRHKTTRDMHGMPITFGLRRPPNLRDVLVNARLTPIDVETDGQQTAKITPRCQKRDCQYCAKLNKRGTITDHYSKRTYRTRYNVTCMSQNLIYCICCTRCNKFYVGQTKRQFRKRMYEHYRDIKTSNPQKTLGCHFSTENSHQGTTDIELFILEFSSKSPTDKFRKHRETLERKWQFRLHTNFPLGLNTDDDLPGSY